MKTYILSGMLAVTALTGCQSFDQAANSKCYDRGYQPGSPSFDRCSNRLSNRMQAEQDATVERNAYMDALRDARRERDIRDRWD